MQNHVDSKYNETPELAALYRGAATRRGAVAVVPLDARTARVLEVRGVGQGRVCIEVDGV
jgi:hypothetical protein